MNADEIILDLARRFPRAEDDIKSWSNSYRRMFDRIDEERLTEAYLATVDGWTRGGFPKPGDITATFHQALPAPNPNVAKERPWDITDRQLRQRHARLLDEFRATNAEQLDALPTDRHRWHVLQIAKAYGFLSAQAKSMSAITLSPKDWTDAQERADSQLAAFERGSGRWPYGRNRSEDAA
jgi:hypothetical protein